MQRSYLVLSLIFIALFGLLYISLRLNFDSVIQNAFAPSDQSADFSETDIRIVHPADSQPNPQDTSQSAEGGGGASAQDASNTKEQNFCTQTIAYTLLDFNEQETCLTLEETCTEKILNCTVSLQNLDYGTGGEFTVNFDFKDRASSQIISSSTQTLSVPPRQTVQFSSSQLFTSSESSLNLECGFSVQRAPSTSVC